MGCDGGSIPLRADMIRVKKKKALLERDVELDIKWKKCALTGEPLREPVVSCELGNLYNKEAVLEMLISKSKPEVASHVRSLKDVVVLQLTSKGSSSDKPTDGAKAETYVDMYDAQFVCPIVGIEMSGRHKFMYIATCGCVMSERALKEVGGSRCQKCNAEHTPDAVRTLNPDKEEQHAIRAQIEERRQAEKEAKLAKKASKRKAEAALGEDDDACTGKSTTEGSAAKKARVAKSSDSAKPTREANVVLTGATRNALNVAEAAMTGLVTAKQYKTVAEDPSASRVYKSLFTSSRKEPSDPTKPKGNWVVQPAYHL
ncbi:replication termination factor 2-like [Sycon ciliatum]|uniref:replication termination factor 2-like n=1 Tax=Sycon ciliatum TaxID=27933 RepID=UPI0031F70D74